VARVSEVLHLAPRTVRDLIYAGRLPSLRAGRLHYIKATDLDVERRRRLALPLPRRRTPKTHRTTDGPRRIGVARAHVDPTVRRQRAAERAAMVSRWARRNGVAQSRMPAQVVAVSTPTTCAACGREVYRGRLVELSLAADQAAERLCLTCGRRALLGWADRRRQEAADARRLAYSLGEPLAQPATPRAA
jgi:hypothetical protein